MNICLERLAPAKVNLFLDVVGRDSRGYHYLQTLFQEISFTDTIRVEISPASTLHVSLRCDALSLPAEQNLAYRAAMFYCKQYGVKANIHMLIDKKIPTGAGLGGGSSNAASVLLLLDQHFGKASSEELAEGALKLGADVPFFLKGGSCWAEGFGEKLTVLYDTWPLWLVLTLPDLHVSTADVFSYLDLSLTEPFKHDKKWDTFFGGTVSHLASRLYNALEIAAFGLHPELKEIKTCLEAMPCLGVVMSGSGSSFVSLVESEAQAFELQEAQTQKGLKSYVCQAVPSRKQESCL